MLPPGSESATLSSMLSTWTAQATRLRRTRILWPGRQRLRHSTWIGRCTSPDADWNSPELRRNGSSWLCFRETLRNFGAIDPWIAAYNQALEAAVGEKQRCQARIGIAAGMRYTNRHGEALQMAHEARDPSRHVRTSHASWRKSITGAAIFISCRVGSKPAWNNTNAPWIKRTAPLPKPRHALSAGWAMGTTCAVAWSQHRAILIAASLSAALTAILEPRLSLYVSGESAGFLQ